jgi:hypothetical protein
MNHPEATQMALSILRKWDNFQWIIIPVLVIVLYIYFGELSKKNYRGVAAGLSLYMIHWFYEILNALIQHFSGHALWTVPTGTSFLLLVGVCIEISLMFSIAGLAASKLLLDDPKAKILGINNRLFFGTANAALASILEIFLAKTPAFVWVYPWWGASTVFISVYIPFFVISAYSYDWKPAVQKKFIGGLFLLNALLLTIFSAFLGWI